jgi:hypothetical protein
MYDGSIRPEWRGTVKLRALNLAFLWQLNNLYFLITRLLWTV